jgi:hypothetical protein
MISWYHALIMMIALGALACSVYYSFRYRRQKEAVLRGLYAARMNIAMGVLLVSVALIQLLLFEPNTLRVVLGALFFLLGAFNFFAGAKNHAIYNSQRRA